VGREALCDQVVWECRRCVRVHRRMGGGGTTLFADIFHSTSATELLRPDPGVV